MITTTRECPSHVTTIDQHRGDHSSGTPYTQLKDISTLFSDYSEESWESLDADGQQWWCDVLADLHAAEVELASLPADHRAAAREAVRHDDDLQGAAGRIRAAVEATDPAAE